jgi:hypothetical protein
VPSHLHTLSFLHSTTLGLHIPSLNYVHLGYIHHSSNHTRATHTFIELCTPRLHSPFFHPHLGSTHPPFIHTWATHPVIQPHLSYTRLASIHIRAKHTIFYPYLRAHTFISPYLGFTPSFHAYMGYTHFPSIRTWASNTFFPFTCRQYTPPSIHTCATRTFLLSTPLLDEPAYLPHLGCTHLPSIHICATHLFSILTFANHIFLPSTPR